MKIAFIREKKSGRYLGVTIRSNGSEADYCGEYSAELCDYSVPHAFKNAAVAKVCLSEDTGWYNSGLERPSREEYNLTNCEIIEVDLP